MNSRQSISSIPGLAAEYNAEIAAIMAKHPEIKRVVLYGSRAKGTYTDRSDIDLAIIGNAIDHQTLGSIRLDLDESDIPLAIDLLDYTTLENQDLKARIDQVGLTIYRSEPTDAGHGLTQDTN
ncbi:nucleotidyltransferase domain-containing protein [Saccharospirillum sp.]|uniref:nucleotidyltransferase domain-containing protein n=1 Tax=Saccharospirillum sp. TaxID=2033801 RepID=UPI0034A00FA8